jgi:hypothetical protein
MTKKPDLKSKNYWPLRQRPGFLVRRLHQIHVALFQKRRAAFEITPLQYSLSTLAEHGTADQTTLAAEVALGSVGIHREFITAAARWIMEAKL